jgi:hypothetical protein
VLDEEDSDPAEAGPGGVVADRIRADHRAGAGGVVVEEADCQAVKNAEAVVEAFDLVAGGEERSATRSSAMSTLPPSVRLARAARSASTGWFMS